MSEELRSFLIGTTAVDVLALVALGLTISRATVVLNAHSRRVLVRLASFAIALQSVHFLEELATGFTRRFAELLGLTPWPLSFFVWFNLTWLAVWVVSLFGLRAGLRVALFPTWFLALASALNGIVHPLLAVAVGGYFPGLWTSPLIGVLGGVVLLRQLNRITGAAEAAD